MSDFQIGMLIACGLTALVSWGNWRAIGWIGALAVSFLASSFYWRAGLPYGEFFAGICDAAVCLLIYAFGRFRWELAVWRMFQGMLLVNLLYLGGNLGILVRIDHSFYSTILEAANILILLTIGGVATLQRVGRDDVGILSSWRPIHRALMALRQTRSRLPFWKVR